MSQGATEKFVMRPIRYGIIGVGHAAHYQADAMYRVADSELVAICSLPDDDPGADSFGVPLVDSYGDLLANPLIDAISICSPCERHAIDALAAVEAGKHVLVNPPLALTLADADTLIDACQRTGVVLSVALQRRTEPQFQVIHAAIAQGELGRLVHSNVVIPFSRQQGVFTSALAHGFLLSEGIHLIDLMVWFMGDIATVQAYIATFANISAREDTIAASVVFANGALGTVSATSAVGYGFPQRLGIYGELAGVQIEGEHVARAKGDGLPARLSDLPGPGDPGPLNDGSPFASSNVAYMRLIEDFSEAIRSDRPPLISGAEGRRSLAAVLAIYAAAGL